MKHFVLGAVAALGVLAASIGGAQTTLSPANPQPSGLKKGLAVTYAFPQDVKTLSATRSALAASPKRGKPLSGLSYPDRGEGANVLTTNQPHYVAARIKGYIKFDKPGVHTVELFTNDGAALMIGGKTISVLDERSPCSSAGRKQVNVPQAGWYDIQVDYFQRWATACLEMDWAAPGGRMGPVPNAAFGYK